MRIAISISGKRGQTKGRITGEKNDLSITYNHLKKNILEKYNSDIFIHTWDKEDHKYFKETFKTEFVISEEQKNFGFDLHNMNEIEKNDEYGKGSEFRAISQTYSFFKSLDLVIKNEVKSNFVYDFIICMRADALICKFINFKKLKKNFIYVQKKINIKKKKIFYNFEKDFIHQSWLLILNSYNVKKINYEDIFIFDINKKENFFQDYRPASTFNFQKPLFVSSEFKTNLPLEFSDIIRRRYFKEEIVYENNKEVKYNYIDPKFIDYNKFIYEIYYQKNIDFNFFKFLKLIPTYMRIKMIFLFMNSKLLIHNISKFFEKIINK